MNATFLNAALTDVCETIEAWELSPADQANLVASIATELEGRAEKAWERQQAALMETGGPDDTAYRKAMKDAGRGHLVRG